MTARPDPYSLADLRPLCDPRSIAIVGASPRKGAFGGRTAANLAGFDGEVMPVNARYEEIDGVPCHPSLSALPRRPDLAVIAAPAESAEAVIEDALAAGVPAAILYASGFAETGDAEDAARQARIAARAAKGGLRLLGPNCVGLLNYSSGARVSFAGVPEGRLTPGEPAIGLVCQSGALGFALAQAMDRGVAFSHVLTAGNSADVDVADWVAALAEDPACSAIACAFEGLADPRRFLRAAEIAWAHDKPLVVFKMASGTEGAAAAMSHTGSLAGSQALWSALFARGGAVEVEDFEALIETAWFFAKTPAPKAPGAAILSGSGGAAIMGADMAEAEGVPLPQPAPETVEVLKARIPPFVPARNPCDVTAQVINDMDTLLACADALLADEAYGSLIFGATYAYDTATARLPHLSTLAEKHGKPLCMIWLTQLLEGPGAREAERDPNIAVFRSTRRCFATLRAWSERAARRAAPDDGPGEAMPAEAAARLDALLSAASGPTLDDAAAAELLELCGIRGPRAILARSAAEAAAAAQEIGGMLALKIASPDIPHKTEAGGVRLGVEGAEAARGVHDAILADVRAARPDARIEGVLVQEMIPPGLEIIAGFHDAEGFGPAVAVGLGGVFAELMRDAATALAPVSEAEAERMLRGLRGAAALDGFRGAPPAPVGEIARAVAALSRLAVASRGRIAELDVNPLICAPDRVVAADALVALADPDR